jgi:hypothetical protein
MFNLFFFHIWVNSQIWLNSLWMMATLAPSQNWKGKIHHNFFDSFFKNLLINGKPLLDG